MSHFIAERPSERSELAAWYSSVLEEQSQSDLSVAEYAELVGVTAATLYSWRRRLGSNRRPSGPPAGLVEVRVRPNDAPSDPTPNLAPALVVRLDRGRSIEVPFGFDAEHLERLLEVIDRC